MHALNILVNIGASKSEQNFRTFTDIKLLPEEEDMSKLSRSFFTIIEDTGLNENSSLIFSFPSLFKSQKKSLMKHSDSISFTISGS